MSAELSPGVQYIVEGLVREYLVKRGLAKTAEAFNAEQPKHPGSITKREVLRKSLGLDRAAAKFKKDNPTAETLPPTLELWVQHTMSKLHNNFFDVPPSAAPVGARGPRARPAADEESEPEEVSVEEPRASFNTSLRGQSRGSPAQFSGGAGMEPGSYCNGVSSRGAAAAPPAGAGGFLTADGRGPRSGIGAAAARLSALDISEPDQGSTFISSAHMGRPGRLPGGSPPSPSPAPPPAFSSPAPPPAARPTPQPPPMPLGSSSSHTSSAAAGGAVMAQGRRPGLASSSSRGRGGELVMQELDVEDEVSDELYSGVGQPLGSGSAPPRGSLMAGGLRGTGATSSPAGRSLGGAKGTPLPPDTARTLRAVLWGARGEPPLSWQQGFFFNDKPRLQFGLVQLEGGPCGVLAGVQAHVLANLQTQAGSFNLTPSRAEQHSALAAAIADVLWQARIGPVAVLAQALPEAGAPASSLGYDQVMRTVVTHSAPSRDALQDLVRTCLPSLMDPRGWGILLLLLSLVLSRGPTNIAADMDEPSNALMGAHGYCTQELVNLIVAGQAVSNVFDGVRDLDGSQLKGITRRCRLGVLTLFEWYKYVEVGSCLKTPDLPVWVVCSESHFTVLFAQDSRALRGMLPFDLLYYDELANQQEIVRLTVSHDPRGGWTARVGDTIGDRGKCEGQNIPPLECVIETRWPGVRVDWNGHEPIL